MNTKSEIIEEIEQSGEQLEEFSQKDFHSAKLARILLEILDEENRKQNGSKIYCLVA